MHYLLIHGIGNQDTNMQWFEDATQDLDSWQRSQFIPFYWEDLREPPLEKHLQAARLCGFSTLTAYSGLMDLLGYGNTLTAVFERLRATLESIEGDVCIVAHSLGSVLAYEYLFWYSKNHPNVKRLVTLGSPIGRRPVSTRIRKRLGTIAPLPIQWINVAGSLDVVTSWLGGGRIKEADYNVVLKGYSHDLRKYIAWLRGVVV